MNKKQKCKHELKYRQAVASSYKKWSNSIVSVVCIKCGKIIYKKMVDVN